MLGWLILAGTLLYLFGLGDVFAHWVGALLAIILAVGGILIILNIKKPEGVLKYAFGAVIVIVLLPPFIAGLLQHVGLSLSWETVTLLVFGILLAALLMAWR